MRPKITEITYILIVLLIAVLLVSCTNSGTGITVLRGGTIIDVGSWGTSTGEIRDAVVIIKHGVITAAGTEQSLVIPKGAEIIDTRGKFIIPGLIDGFATLNNQSYANAFLYSGVTSIIGLSSFRRGELVLDAEPSPRIFRLESVGDDPLPTDTLFAQLENLAADGVKVALLMYQVQPDQIEAVIQKAQSLGLGTIGELGHTPYAKGIEYGIDAFVHTTRYSLNAAPPDLQRNVADNPFSDDLNSYKWQYYRWLSRISPDDPALQRHAKTLAGGKTALMPTFGLLYLDQEFSRNPWLEPAASILNAADINSPADRSTGKHDYEPDRAAAYAELAANIIDIENVYYTAGARYLAGSATDVWGTMPGISLHQELECLKRAGLTEREVLAAATGNFNELFGWDIGRIAEGFKADILVLDENPLEDIENLKNISLLIVSGKLLDRDALIGRN